MSQAKANFTIPGYTLISRIGRGATATVWLAEQHALNRQVAIKVPHTFADEDSRTTKRFMREAMTVAQLDHPGIVAIHDFGRTQDGHFYYVMPYLNNGDLRSLKWQSDKDLVVILCAICDALAYAHDHGVVHRDLKPENILLTAQGMPLIADFGIALTPGGDARITSDGLTVGSCFYMSPEQARSRDIDGRSDLYSIGVMLFELLTGRVPYDAPDEFSVLLMHANDPLPALPVSQTNWAPVIKGCLGKKPEQRFDDARALSQAIESVHLRPAASRTLEHPMPVSKRFKIPGMGAALLALLVVAAAIGGWALWVSLSGPQSAGETALPQSSPATQAQIDVETAKVSGEQDSSVVNEAQTGTTEAANNPQPGAIDDRAAEQLAAQLGVDWSPAPDARSNILERAMARLKSRLETRSFEQAVADAQSINALVAQGQLSAAELELLLASSQAQWRAGLTSADQSLDGPAAQAYARILAAFDLLDEQLIPLAWRADQIPHPGATISDNMGVKMVLVPPVAIRPGAEPRTLSRGFAMSTQEISRALYAQFVAETKTADSECTRPGNTVPFIRKYFWHDPGFEQADDHPVVCVTYANALAFASWFSDKTGTQYRLPTESEWLQAAWSDDPARTACASGNVADQSAVSAGGRGRRFECNDGYAGTAPGASFAVNRIGVFDLRGNVREWTSNCAGEIPGGSRMLDAVGIKDSEPCHWRAVRGTSWWDGMNRSMIEFREEMPADRAYAHVGIRLVQPIPEIDQ